MKKSNNMIDDRFFLAVLNSKLLWYFMINTGDVLRGGYFRFKSRYLEPFCIPKPPKKIQESLIKKVELMLNLKKKLSETKTNKEELTNEIMDLDNKINELVYDLYDLDNDEKQLVNANYPV